MRQDALRFTLFVALAIALAGCSGGHPEEKKPPEAWRFHSAAPSGSEWLAFPQGVHGTVTASASLVRFPVALQATWIGANGVVRPILFGFEMDFHHQEGTVGGGVPAASWETSPLQGLPTNVGTHADLNESAAGWLVIAWATPSGSDWLGNFSQLPESERLSPAQFDSLTQDNSTWAYTPAVQGSMGDGGGGATSPQLLNLRLITPTNAGQGTFVIHGTTWSTSVAVNQFPNASCIDCFEVRRFIGETAEPWQYKLSFVGRSGAFQAYLMAVDMPPGAGHVPDGLSEFPDCVFSFTSINEC